MAKSEEELNRIKVCSYLLPDPGGEVVRDLIKELEELKLLLGTTDEHSLIT